MNNYGFRMSDTAKGSVTDWFVKNPAGAKSLLTVIILLSTCILGFASRLFAVIRFESIIHEFDPWFNYRATHTLTTQGKIIMKYR
jgi:asparagine N-glycosylation enzyme membrane subunit Stt3